MGHVLRFRFLWRTVSIYLFLGTGTASLNPDYSDANIARGQRGRCSTKEANSMRDTPARLFPLSLFGVRRLQSRNHSIAAQAKHALTPPNKRSEDSGCGRTK